LGQTALIDYQPDLLKPLSTQMAKNKKIIKKNG
jgi:hypothetical protein